MKRLPIGIQTFPHIIEQNYLYVDKTRDIHRLLTTGGKYYFLSRPRRFGKSLLISTLKELFSGNKELFKGTWIYNHGDWPWEKHPVIHIDFLGLKYGSSAELMESLEFLVDRNARNHGISLKSKGYDKRFNELLQTLSEKGKLVVLVDEYDKPIINHIENQEIAIENRNLLRTFYEAIKGADQYIKFVFVTGVSKFSKVSIFSGLNNLDDITIDDRFSTLLGYTREELLENFKDRLAETSFRLEDIKKWYNGYSWDGVNFVYNPLSILQFFNKGKFNNYWFATGTPTFLINFIRKNNIDVKDFENYETGPLIFDSFDIDRIDIVPLLFQTGYLTIKEVMEISHTQLIYRLSYPNEEVRQSFLEHLAADFTGKFPSEMGGLIYKLQKSLKDADLPLFFEILTSVFASVPYDLFIRRKEAYYHTIIYMILNLLSVNIKVEPHTNKGRIDCVIETDTNLFLMEFKMGDAEKGLKQIKEKKYYEKYLASGKKIVLIGVGFDAEERNIKDFKAETLL